MSEEEWKEQKEGKIFEFQKENDFVEGTLISVENDVGQHKSKLYSLKKDSGEIVKIWGSKVLDGKMSGIEFKTLVKIVFNGLVTPDKGNEYKSFSVFYKVNKEETV